jgi:tetratricopeptide (TPR) repeat protein
MARLDRFAPVKEIAQIGAAIGREFSYELLAAVAPHSKPELDKALAQLAASGLAFQQGAPPDAAYTFKHALVQDAAYDSLLRRRRHDLHGRIASVIGERLPQIKATEPELLAHHYTEAKLFPKAIPLWQQAGSLALKRMALAEAIAHLNKGLKLVAALPASAERDSNELDVRTLLGTAWVALKSWTAQEVWDNLFPALGLAESLGRNHALLPVLCGLFAHVVSRGRAAESLRWATRMQEVAETSGDPDLLIVGHYAAVSAYSWLGDPMNSLEQSNRVLALYSEERHAHLVGILNHDPKAGSLVFAANSTWVLGYPEQAAQLREDSEAHARKIGHPFNLAWALTEFSTLFDYRGEPEVLLKRLSEAERLGRENSMSYFANVVPRRSGVALIRMGRVAEGIALLERGIAVWEESGGRSNIPYYKSVLAEGMAQLGDLKGAGHLIDEESERAQYRLPADLRCGISAGRCAGPQIEPERGPFSAARAHPQGSGGYRKPTLSPPQSVARRSAGLSPDVARIHAASGGAMPSAGAALRLGARSAGRFLRRMLRSAARDSPHVTLPGHRR